MTWDQGRLVVDAMLARGQVERVPPSRAHADHLLSQGSQHLAAAQAIIDAVATMLDQMDAY